jgi:quercetin dioxygenase-like cupin family protein
MIETVHNPAKQDIRTIETLVSAESILINHMILPEGEGLPEHDTNAHVNLVILRGTLSVRLGDQPAAIYQAGQIIEIPRGTRMNLRNFSKDILEFYVIKTPNPNAGK